VQKKKPRKNQVEVMEFLHRAAAAGKEKMEFLENLIDQGIGARLSQQALRSKQVANRRQSFITQSVII